MSRPVSRKLVEGRSGNLFVVDGNPEIGYTLHHATLTEVGHYKRSWEAVRRAQDGHDEALVIASDDDDFCEALSPYGHVCTRSKGHDGQHAAHGESDTEPLRVWPS